MTSPSQEMLNTCTSGDVQALHHLFATHNIHTFAPVYTPPPTGPPPTNSPLAAAITNRHLNVASLILRTYSGPRIHFTSPTIDALLHNPYLAILQALYEYDPYVVSFEWDGHTDTFVTKACEQPPEKITPLLLWLIEHGADLEGGHFQRTVCKAILGGQGVGVVKAMVEKRARVGTLEMREAVVCERVDVIRFL